MNSVTSITNMDQQVQIEKFFESFPSQTIKKDIILFDPFQIPSGIYYLKEGFVRQYTTSEDGRELTIHIYTPSSHFPMFWAFDLYPNHHSFQAMTSLKVYLAPKSEVIKFFKTHPESSLYFMKRLLLGIEGLTKRLEVNAFSNAYTKVISAMIYLGSHFGVQEGNVIRIRERFTHERIATITGLTREHVSLELEKLKRENLISFEDHTIILSDLSKLAEKIPF